MTTVKMYTCAGWQNAATYSTKRQPMPVSVSEYPAEHAHPVIGFTHARNESLEELIADLKQAAGVDTLRYEVQPAQ